MITSPFLYKQLYTGKLTVQKEDGEGLQKCLMWQCVGRKYPKSKVDKKKCVKELFSTSAQCTKVVKPKMLFDFKKSRK